MKKIWIDVAKGVTTGVVGFYLVSFIDAILPTAPNAQYFNMIRCVILSILYLAAIIVFIGYRIINILKKERLEEDK